MVERESIIKEWKKREYYEKPSVIRNRKKKAMRSRARRRAYRQYSVSRQY